VSVAQSVKDDLAALATARRAEAGQWFFKTGPGEYGEGDVFVGVTVPNQRRVAKRYRDLPPSAIKKLLSSKVHEHRLTACFILVSQFEASTNPTARTKLFKLFVASLEQGHVNNWDLIDSSVPNILGGYLMDHPARRSLLYDYAVADQLWLRRAAIMGTFRFIRNDDFADALAICEILVHDTHHLIQKAVGWMLREIGQRDQPAEAEFLRRHHQTMPRTMLRYAIEKFPPIQRQVYLRSKA
jgi:3-methyladenine DNA glycosylase AlkD